jgi:hypothetical protein
MNPSKQEMGMALLHPQCLAPDAWRWPLQIHPATRTGSRNRMICYQAERQGVVELH